MDRNFDKATFEKQMSVMRGQVGYFLKILFIENSSLWNSSQLFSSIVTQRQLSVLSFILNQNSSDD